MYISRLNMVKCFLLLYNIHGNLTTNIFIIELFKVINFTPSNESYYGSVMLSSPEFIIYCTNTNTYAHAHAHTHARTHARTHTHTHTHTHTCTQTHTYTYTQTHICMHTHTVSQCVCVCLSVCLSVCACVQMY